MTWTIDAALEDQAIERTQQTEEGYSFWLKGISTEIRVILSFNPVRGGFNFHLSHFIRTPNQIGRYTPGRPWGDDEGYALHLAVTAITQYYGEAVKAGINPSPDWLIENKSGI